MKPQAIICDVYRTILEILPPPEDAGDRWMALCQDALGESPKMSLQEFFAACRASVRRRHEEAKSRGVAFPEVQWPEVLAEVVPGFGRLPPEQQRDFQVAEQGLSRGLGLVAGAARVLREWADKHVVIGIASNAQAYTIPELRAALAPENLSFEIFAPDLSIWSWQMGFSKPDPYFFQVLLARLIARGLEPGRVLMVGDRADNDMAPAREAGLMTWHLHPDGDGGWEALQAACEI